MISTRSRFLNLLALPTASFFLCLISAASLADKPAVDFAAISDKWSYVDHPAISNNGRYVAFQSYHGLLGQRSLALQDVSGNWHKAYPGIAGQLSFTDDSRQAVFLDIDHNLNLLILGSDHIERFPRVETFDLIPLKSREWLIYRTGNPESSVVLVNLTTGYREKFESATSYLMSPNHRFLVVQTASAGTELQQLRWIDLTAGAHHIIWEGRQGASLVFDASGQYLAFTEEIASAVQLQKVIWRYRNGSSRAARVADGRTPGIEAGLSLDTVTGVSKDGGLLFIALKSERQHLPDRDAVKVDVWGYRDVKLQSQQLKEFASGSSQTYAATLDTENHKVVRLQRENEEITFFGEQGRDDIAIVAHSGGGDKSEWNWNPASQRSFFLVSTRSGDRTALDVNYPSLSKGGKYLIGTDSTIEDVNNNFIVYDLKTGEARNVTGSLPAPPRDEEVYGSSTLRDRGLYVAGWSAGDRWLVVGDRYDLWRLDPTSKEVPVNLTNGFGRRNLIRLSPTVLSPDSPHSPINPAKPMMLSAFDETTKNAGFYSTTVDGKSDPLQVVMGPFVFGQLDFVPLLKARDAGRYLIGRESVSQSRNYFLTRDLKHYQGVTDNYPEKHYNWVTSELVTFTTVDGREEQGALYKPDDFDQSKRYPVIIHYYESKTQLMNHYHPPEPTTSDINIPWFVSRGYLVFTPDIHYTAGQPKQSASDTVIGAANYLSGLPWVDPSRLGLQGHSWGGFETNYIVAHSNIFAAAMSSSGGADSISDGLDLLPNTGKSRQFFYEVDQNRIGATLWERPDLYIKDSPIFDADKVTTPLLMMNNKNDGGVPFSRGVEWFIGLRRLGKKVWMLQYDGEGHSLDSAGSAATTHTIRVTQFFDHYLKGLPPPKWMTEGIPARLKGLDDGMELDRSGKIP